jgi:hypothetical protein
LRCEKNNKKQVSEAQTQQNTHLNPHHVPPNAMVWIVFNVGDCGKLALVR